MNVSRRCFGFFLPLLAKSQTDAQSTTLRSGAFRFEDLPVKQNGSYSVRQIFRGLTHRGLALDLHESDLAPGKMPHPPHQHVHEELLLIKEGQIEITINGKTSQLNSGSAAYLASGDLHGWKNTGTSTARYFVLALGDDKT